MKIVENDDKYLDDFIRLNEEWILKYFKIELFDLELAKNPHKIIDCGGYVFSLISGNDVLGVCALYNMGEGIYELARMAVLPAHQKKGYADLLLEYALKKIKAINAIKLYLVSNTALKPAILLYKKHGFITVYEGVHPVYSRANIIMEYPF